VLERTGEFFVGAGTSEEATNREGAQNPTELGVDTGDRIAVDTPDLGGDEVLVTREASASLLSYSPAVVGTQRAEDPTKYSERRLLLNAQEELAPVVTSVSPGSGSTAGGNTVLITGKYLDSAINVVFGSRPATTFSVDLAGEHITATAPASNAGAVDVHVSNLHSTSETVAADRYTFVAPSGPGSGSSPPPGGGGPGNGGTGPVVTGFKQSAARWRRGSALPHISSVPVGTTFAFGLNETANVSLSFVRVAAGRRVGGKCVAPSPRNRNRAKCRRNVTAGTLPVAGHAGLDKVRFQGHLSRAKQLSPGSYTVSIAARGAKGSRRLTRSLAFTILP
jgi:hypothetical protein